MGVGASVSSTSSATRQVVVVMVIVLGLVPIPLIALMTLVFMSGGLQWPGQPPPAPNSWWVPFSALLVMNFIAPIAFAKKSATYGWWLQLAVQGIDLLVVTFVVVQLGTAGLLLNWPVVVCFGCALVTVGLLLLLIYVRR